MIRRLLRVNLSSGDSKTERIPEGLCEALIGGRGFAIAYLYKELAPHIDPLGPENRLLFLIGPLAGTQAQSSSRWMVATGSPLTGTYARSLAGADFGAWLRFAGYDGMLVEGRAESPVYLHVTNEGCTINQAWDLWGMDTRDTRAHLLRRHGSRTRIACIGPAGERLAKYAAIVSGRRSASRCGVGAVMGAKNLKAVAITARKAIRVFDPEKLKALANEQKSLFKASLPFKHHKEWGTTYTQNVTDALGIFPVLNFRYGQLSEGWKLFGEEYRKIRTGEFACYNCSARCGKAHAVTTGPYAGAASEGPEYETLWVFSGPIGSTSKEATVWADQRCEDLGLDTISLGSTIGFAYELYEKGIIDRNDADGMELLYGDHQTMVALIEKVAKREGFGDILAEGVARAARIIGRGAEKQPYT
jgi:aldehyde:ferredoxin oxidoreductase